MKKCIPIILLILLALINTNAQKKLVFDLNVGLNKSIGKNITKSKNYPGATIEYFTQKK